MPVPRAPLVPVMMVAICPACGETHELHEDQWSETESGAYEALDEARFPVCEACGTQFEVAPIEVREVSA